ncbi:transcriptional repressor [Mycobacterium phage Beezoo]|uniref:Helix-turn-helix DNA binding protein n=1 Tax=Mycobacterium phage Beezoo TaxID=2250355 RepID=A0A2Z5H747_9CAUD|nr:transcriptional repressor [Mycobacterium phage Beezoo]AXC35789.1 helix-turn-helix DNA binding protein [Mycobacterium phage Beezoo]
MFPISVLFVLASHTVQTTTHQLRWRRDNVAKRMRRNNIQDRATLAKRINVGRTTIYSTFRADWSGVATHTVLAQIVGELGGSLSELVSVEARA